MASRTFAPQEIFNLVQKASYILQANKEADYERRIKLIYDDLHAARLKKSKFSLLNWFPRKYKKPTSEECLDVFHKTRSDGILFSSPAFRFTNYWSKQERFLTSLNTLVEWASTSENSMVELTDEEWDNLLSLSTEKNHDK